MTTPAPSGPRADHLNKLSQLLRCDADVVVTTMLPTHSWTSAAHRREAMTDFPEPGGPSMITTVFSPRGSVRCIVSRIAARHTSTPRLCWSIIWNWLVDGSA